MVTRDGGGGVGGVQAPACTKGPGDGLRFATLVRLPSVISGPVSCRANGKGLRTVLSVSASSLTHLTSTKPSTVAAQSP